MMEIFRRVRLGLAIVALTPGLTAGQEFDADKIRVGQTVLVRDLAGAETKGVVQSAETSRLVVKYGVGRYQDPTDPGKALDDTRTFTPAEVDRVRRPGPIWDGAVKGALVGLIPLVLVTAGCSCGAPTEGLSSLFLGVGAAIGLGIDAAWGPETVYRNRGTSRKVTLAPIIGRDRRGFAASIRF